MSLPVGTILTLDLPPLDEDGAVAAGLPVGSPDPWALIRVNALRDLGPDRGGIENIVAPVTFSRLSSPKAVSDDSLWDIGYQVQTEGQPEAVALGAPSASTSSPIDSGPAFGEPGWARADRVRAEAARRLEAEAEQRDIEAAEVAARAAAEARLVAADLAKAAAIEARDEQEASA